jgi:hypothetical protein
MPRDEMRIALIKGSMKKRRQAMSKEPQMICDKGHTLKLGQSRCTRTECSHYKPTKESRGCQNLIPYIPEYECTDPRGECRKAINNREICIGCEWWQPKKLCPDCGHDKSLHDRCCECRGAAMTDPLAIYEQETQR